MLHILDRFTVHIGLQSSPVIAIGIMFLIAMARRLLKYEWIPAPLFPTAVGACLIALLIFLAREAYDVGVVHDPWGKSYVDFASHLIALALLLIAIRKFDQWAKRGQL